MQQSSKRTLGDGGLNGSKRRRVAVEASCSKCQSVRLALKRLTNLPNITPPEGRLIAILPQELDPQCMLCRLLGSVRPHEGFSGLARVELRSYSFIRTTPDFGGDRTLLPAEMRRRDFTHLVAVPAGADPSQISELVWRNGSIFHDLGRPAAKFDTGALVVPRDLERTVNIILAKKWMAYCLSNHARSCSGRAATLPGLRLIDCQTMDRVPATPGARYAALSYVWGTDPYQETDRAEQRTGTPADLAKLMPRTVSDAVTACRRLDIPYLWVDRYCINQADAAESHHQISHMDQIYEAAEITLIAAAGDDAHRGLPGVGSTTRHVVQPIDLDGILFTRVPPHPHHSVATSKWDRRGWTFQEGHLSKRRLVFTDHQMYFECQAMHCNESTKWDLDLIHSKRKDKMRSCMRAGMFPMPHSTTRNPQSLVHRVYGGSDSHCFQTVTLCQALIETFSARELTYAEDSLRAFNGMLRHYSARVAHVWGIPHRSPAAATTRALVVTTSEDGARSLLAEDALALDQLLRSLLWRHRDTETGRPGVHRRPSFPSWTWAGWSGRVEFPWARFPFHDDYAHCAPDLKFEFPNGKIISAHDVLATPSTEAIYPSALIIDCLVLNPKHQRVAGWWYERRLGPRPTSSASQGSFTPSLSLDMGEIELQHMLDANNILFAIFGGASDSDLLGLVLRETDTEVVTSHERIGVVQITVPTELQPLLGKSGPDMPEDRDGARTGLSPKRTARGRAMVKNDWDHMGVQWNTVRVV